MPSVLVTNYTEVSEQGWAGNVRYSGDSRNTTMSNANHYRKPIALSSDLTPVRRVLEIISPPIRERNSRTGSAKERQAENERNDLGSTVQGASNNVIVFGECTRILSSYPPLTDDPGDHPSVDLSVYSDRQIAGILENDTGIKVLEDFILGELAIYQVVNYRNYRSHSQGDRNHVVNFAWAEHFTSKSPRDGVGVERLRILSGP